MTNRDSANRGELLPLPRWMERLDDTSRADITNYARANVERALAESREECERLRERDIRWQQIANLARQADIDRDHHKARAERLAGALREMLELRQATQAGRLTERHELEIVADARAALTDQETT